MIWYFIFIVSLSCQKVADNDLLRYLKVASTSPSHSEAHFGFFRLSMKGKCDVYLDFTVFTFKFFKKLDSHLGR